MKEKVKEKSIAEIREELSNTPIAELVKNCSDDVKVRRAYCIYKLRVWNRGITI